MRFRWEKSCDKKILNFFSELKVFKNLNFKKADILLFDTHFTQICNFYEFDSKIFLEKIQIFFEKKLIFWSKEGVLKKYYYSRAYLR